MRTKYIAILLSATVCGGIVLALASGQALATPKKSILTYYFKTTSQRFTNAAGKPLGKHSKFAAGDHLIVTVDAYLGTAAHHGSRLGGTAFLYCTTKKPTKTELPAVCDGVVALRGSVLAGVSKQNLASSSKTMVYPIQTGTGKYAGAKGTVRTTSVGKNKSNAVITIV